MTSLRSLRSVPAVVLGGLAAVLLAATPAGAHTGHPVEGFADGVLHPITGPDHLLAMLAVGVVAATMRRSVWVAPAAFVGGMLAGGLAGMAGTSFPGAEVLILGSVLLLGLTIAGALQDSGRWVFVALAVAGAAHGHAHGAEAPEAANLASYLVGFLAATVALHLTGVGVGVAIRDRRTARLGFGLALVAGAALLAA
jgi:urease accessory protein